MWAEARLTGRYLAPDPVAEGDKLKHRAAAILFARARGCRGRRRLPPPARSLRQWLYMALHMKGGNNAKHSYRIKNLPLMHNISFNCNFTRPSAFSSVSSRISTHLCKDWVFMFSGLLIILVPRLWVTSFRFAKKLH